MKMATLKQARKILELAEDVPAEHLQELLESGLLSILFKANVDEMMDRMNRNDFRKLCSLVPLLRNLKIVTASFDPIRFIGKSWEILPEYRDERSTAFKEVDFSEVEYLSCLEERETSIKGQERFRRLQLLERIRYGATVFMGLWLNYHKYKENCVLECLYQEKNIAYMDFFGDVLQSPEGHRYVLSLHRGNIDIWYWELRPLDDDWHAKHISVVSLQAS